MLQNITRWLTPDGRLLFSTERPVYTARLLGEGWIVEIAPTDGAATDGLLDAAAYEALTTSA